MESTAKISQAKEAMKKGKSAVSTGILKWSPNHNEAVIHFEKAAKLFKEAGLRNEQYEALLKLGKSCEALNELYTAADAYMQAANLEKDPAK